MKTKNKKIKCPICGKDIISTELFSKSYDVLNSAVVSGLLVIAGHKECLNSINKLIIIPN